MKKIAINGFGRIGRMVFRRLMHDRDVEVVAVNASYPSETLAHLLKYDTIHGVLSDDIQGEQDAIVVNGRTVRITSERDPAKLPWSSLDVDLVVEATGKFRDREGAAKHLQSGAEKVVITAPGKAEDAMIVMGVNDDQYDPDRHHVVSNASCTTNCLAPVVKAVDEAFGLVRGTMTTVHSFTHDQNNLDNPHKDLRRARACGQSIIPTSTGAARAVSQILPHLQGKLDGLALRVPTPNVSIVDLVAEVERDVSVAEVNRALQTSAQGTLKPYIQYTEEPLVSNDFTGNEHSAIIDGLSTMVIGERQLKVLAWYDNEWGYSCRVVDLVKHVLECKTERPESTPQTLSYS